MNFLSTLLCPLSTFWNLEIGELEIGDWGLVIGPLFSVHFIELVNW